jgi:hypothetical protein
LEVEDEAEEEVGGGEGGGRERGEDGEAKEEDGE